MPSQRGTRVRYPKRNDSCKGSKNTFRTDEKWG
jgi:hypothetical protein